MSAPIPARMRERPLPHSAEAERAILGAIILDNGLVNQAIELLRPDDFYVPAHYHVFRAMISMSERGAEVNPILLGETLRREGVLEQVGGIGFISALSHGMPWVGSISAYAEIVRRKSLARQGIKAANKVLSDYMEDEDEPEAVGDAAARTFSALSRGEDANCSLPASLPVLRSTALRGPAGEFVELIGPHTEASPAALLVQFLIAFGNCVGRSPYFAVEADRHSVNLFGVIVGTTASGRKGTSWGHVRRLFESVDEGWAHSCIASGLSSGEGLIWAVRDPIEQVKPQKERGRATGQYEKFVADQGAEDKRVLVLESEFASVLRMQGREGNTLSPLLRQAWDDGNLRSLTKNSPARATGAHVSIIGHITGEELRRSMCNIEVFNGYANRFLWVLSCRSKFLPEGGRAHEENFTSLVHTLSQAVGRARRASQVERDAQARALWRFVYRDLTTRSSGMFGSLTARAAPQVVRLSLLYALLDGARQIGQVHLEAALALWKYSEDSVRYLFGEQMGDRLADEILRALRTAGGAGLTVTEINRHFHGHRRREEIERALSSLAEAGLAASQDTETRGRTARRWFALSGIAE